MKKHIVLTTLVVAGVVLTFTISPTSNRAEKPATPAVTGQAQPANAPSVTAPTPREPEPLVSTMLPPPNPREQRLKTRYESPGLAERLSADRHIAARGDELAFFDLAAFIAEAEATGDYTLVEVARQGASILAQMHGPEILTAATELAYSPSALVAEAAVNAAVASEPETNPQWFDSGSFQNPADQDALDAFVQQVADIDRIELPALPEK